MPYIQGVQSQGVVATVKHYALNNSEFDRHNASAEVDERTMREIYLPAFEAAVTQGHVDAVMDSYNEVNSVHATENEFLNLKLLKGEWGFNGVLMSDWTATYDGVAAANNGLDLEMPKADFMNAQTLIPAVKDGRVKESTIDDKVLRLLRTELRYGFADRPQFDPSDAIYSLRNRAVALQEALESITLLKNQGNMLPLDASKIKTVAVIGPNAWPAIVGGGGSAEAAPLRHCEHTRGSGGGAGAECKRALQPRAAGCNRRHEEHALAGRGEGGVLRKPGVQRNAGDGIAAHRLGLELLAMGARGSAAQRALYGGLQSCQGGLADICCWLRETEAMHTRSPWTERS